MNAMIAFINEELAKILACKEAILAREITCLIVDMYQLMSEKQKKETEEKNKW